VQNPLKYAEVLLSYASPKTNYTAEGIKKMLGGEEKQLDFVNQIPVHLMYQTAFVDEAGKPQFREDIYGLDTKLMSILKGSERQVADVAIERPADPNFKPTPEQGQKLRSAAAGFSAKNDLKSIEKGRISSIRPLTMSTIHLDLIGHFSPYSPCTTSRSGAGGP
jgi:hypothetical protein